MPLLKISAAAKELGVSKSVLREWDKAGKIETVRSPGGMRLFDIANIAPAIAAKTSISRRDCSVVLYARVSCSSQGDELELQQRHLRDRLPDKYARSSQIPIFDVGSGLNLKRPGLMRALGLVREGRVSALVVTSRDRLARFAFDLVEWVCAQHGTALVVLEPGGDSAPEAELGRELMTIVQMYNNNSGSSRNNANKKGSPSSSSRSDAASSCHSNPCRSSSSSSTDTGIITATTGTDATTTSEEED